MGWHEVFKRVGVPEPQEDATGTPHFSPVNGQLLGCFRAVSPQHVSHALDRATECFLRLRQIPAPVRGELVRRFSLELRAHQADLAYLVTLESGKLIGEAWGEVQEMIDVCEFAVGLSRQLHGLTIASERPHHRMMEQWHPLGPVAVISAFNFPVAVWAWNSALALVCGNPILWKPSPQGTLSAFACHGLLVKVAQEHGQLPPHLSQVLLGEGEIGMCLAGDPRTKLVSATGSSKMGREVAARVGARLGRSLLELGGNNAMIVGASANLDLALRAIVFSAVGTSGQRCTSLRRLIVHQSRIDELLGALKKAYQSLVIGDPFLAKSHMGPLINLDSYEKLREACEQAEREGGKLEWGGQRISSHESLGSGVYVEPALLRMKQQTQTMSEEVFAPLLYVLPFSDLQEAIDIQNAVPQGLSSAIFTENMSEAELFLSTNGSDCGIANVNIGTSGAEIGGAFGGEKDTGGGRESGSDAWKNYMRRSTNTINYGKDLPLAQGIEFEFS